MWSKVFAATIAALVLSGCAEEASAPREPTPPAPPPPLAANGDLLFARGDYTLGLNERWRVFAAVRGGRSVSRASPLVFARPPLPSPDGRRLAFTRLRGGIRRLDDVHVVRLAGRHARLLTRTRWGDWPAAWSPNGRRLLVGHDAGVGHTNVSVVEVNGRGRRLVRVDGTAADGATWAPDSRRVLARASVFGPRGLHAVDLDTGASRRVTPEDEVVDWGLFAPNGRLVLTTARPRPLTHDLWIADESGSNRELVASTRGDFWGIEFSRDGARLALSVLFGDDDTSRLVVLPATARNVEITGTSGVAGRHAVWSPDGTKLAFVRGRFPTDDVWVMTADGRTQRRLTSTREAERPLAWLPASGG